MVTSLLSYEMQIVAIDSLRLLSKLISALVIAEIGRYLMYGDTFYKASQVSKAEHVYGTMYSFEYFTYTQYPLVCSRALNQTFCKDVYHTVRIR